MVEWHHGTMAPWCHGTTVPWYHGTSVFFVVFVRLPHFKRVALPVAYDITQGVEHKNTP